MKLNEEFEKTITSECVEEWRYPRFFSGNISDSTVFIDGTDASHIMRVLRMRRGDLAVVCDCRGNDLLCRITSTSDKMVELDIIGRKPSAGEPDIRLRLFQCLPKSDKMDFIVQKAVELGIVEVIPVISKRCVSRPDSASSDKKRVRWQRIAEEAAKQCGRGIIPQVGETVSFCEAIKSFDSSKSTGIFFYECGGKRLNDIIEKKKCDNIDIFIGSEGGFEKEEAQLAESAGITTATLGTRILRCETAPIAAISILMNLTNNM